MTKKIRIKILEKECVLFMVKVEVWNSEKFRLEYRGVETFKKVEGFLKDICSSVTGVRYRTEYASKKTLYRTSVYTDYGYHFHFNFTRSQFENLEDFFVECNDGDVEQYYL